MKQSMQVLTSRGTDEWYTPSHIVDRARLILGDIDLDPASNDVAQRWIRAHTYYTSADDGLLQPWRGRVWLNPPFQDTPRWVRALVEAYRCRDVSAAVLLVNSNLGYSWYERLWTRYPVCCLRERLCFIKADGTPGGQAKRAQTLVYMGDEPERFHYYTHDLGRVLFP